MSQSFMRADFNGLCRQAGRADGAVQPDYNKSFLITQMNAEWFIVRGCNGGGGSGNFSVSSQLGIFRYSTRVNRAICNEAFLAFERTGKCCMVWRKFCLYVEQNMLQHFLYGCVVWKLSFIALFLRMDCNLWKQHFVAKDFHEKKKWKDP